MGTQTNVQYSEDPGIQVPMFHQNGAILNNNLDRLLVFAVWCHTPRATPSIAFLNVDKGEFKSSLMSLEHQILFLTLSEKKILPGFLVLERLMKQRSGFQMSALEIQVPEDLGMKVCLCGYI